MYPHSEGFFTLKVDGEPPPPAVALFANGRQASLTEEFDEDGYAVIAAEPLRKALKNRAILELVIG